MVDMVLVVKKMEDGLKIMDVMVEEVINNDRKWNGCDADKWQWQYKLWMKINKDG